jgi:RNA binding exosome subunit
MAADAEIATALPAIMAQVKTEIFERRTEGQGRHGNSITYAWRANRLTSSKNVLNFFDELTGTPKQGSFTMGLDSIALTVSHKRNGGTREAQYEYQELSWTK